MNFGMFVQVNIHRCTKCSARLCKVLPVAHHWLTKGGPLWFRVRNTVRLSGLSASHCQPSSGAVVFACMSSRPRRAYLRPWTPCVQPILCAWPRGQTHWLLGSLSAQAGEATSRVAHPIGRTAATLTSLAKSWSQPIPAPLPPCPPSVPPPPFPPPTRLYGVAHDPPGPALLAAGAHSVPRRRPARPPRGRPHVHAPGGGYCGVVPAVAGGLHQPHQPVPPARADDAVKVAVMLQLGRLVRGPDR